MSVPQIGDIVQIELIGRVVSVAEDSGKVRIRVDGENWQNAYVLYENVKEIVRPS